MAAPPRHRRPLNRPQRGQTIVLFALGSLMLMAMLGLAIDAGYNYAQRREMQVAADAAAQAGAKALHAKEDDDDIYAAAWDAAVKNGFPPVAANFKCYFIYKNFQSTQATTSPTQCNSLPVSDTSTYAGVQIQIKEQHTTFVMRAIGITQSGTAAVSTAQVQILATLDMANAPFIACGYNSKRTSGSTSRNILDYYSGSTEIYPATTTGYDLPYNEGSPEGTAKLSIDDAFRNGWDWTTSERPPDGDLLPPDSGTRYYLWNTKSNFTITTSGGVGNDKSLCNAAPGFWGGNGNRTNKYTLNPTGLYDDSANPPLAGYPTDVVLPVLFSSTLPSGPASQIQGPLGCAPGDMTDCVLILPIADLAELPNAPTPPASPSPSPKPAPNATALRIRAWGAFWVTYVPPAGGIPESYVGQLIKYYPMQGDGWNEWSRNIDFTGPVVIHLIR